MEFKPSVSRIIKTELFFNGIGLLHIQIPFVQGLVDGPISKPFI